MLPCMTHYTSIASLTYSPDHLILTKSLNHFIEISKGKGLTILALPLSLGTKHSVYVSHWGVVVQHCLGLQSFWFSDYREKAKVMWSVSIIYTQEWFVLSRNICLWFFQTLWIVKFVIGYDWWTGWTTAV